MSKRKPTPEMIEYRKLVAQKNQDQNNKVNDYNAQANIKRMAVKKRIDRLAKNRDLAAEAAIGYGLAIKSIEENIRNTEVELDEINLEIEKERPPYRYASDDFKIKFGITEFEVDWEAPEVGSEKRSRANIKSGES